MKLIQFVKELRMLVAETRKLAILIHDWKDDKSEKPSRPANN